MSARYKDIFREIKKSFGRFLSILLIVAAGVGFFVGVKATAPSMYQTADQYFQRQNLMDLEIFSTVGFSDDDVEKIREVEHVDRVFPTYSADLLLDYDGDTLVTSIMSLPEAGEDSINTPVLVKGRMPEAEDECIVTTSEVFGVNGMEIGQKVTFLETSGNTKVDDILERRTFTVVGMVNLPQYISYSYGTSSVGSGEISLVMMVPKSNFTYPRYTGMLVTLDCKDSDISYFSEEYDAILSDVTEQLTNLGDVQFRAFVEDTEKQIEDAESEFNDGKQDAEEELGDAKGQLDDAKRQIEEGLQALMQGWVDYEAGSEEAKKQFEDAEKQIEEYKIQIIKGESELESSEEKIKFARGLLDRFLLDSEIEENYEAAQTQYDEAVRNSSEAESALAAAQSALSSIESSLEGEEAEEDDRLRAARAEVESAQSNFDAAQEELNLAQNNMDAAELVMYYLSGYDDIRESIQQEIINGEVEIEVGWKELEEGKRQLAEAEEELKIKKAEAEEELLDAYRQLVSSETELELAQEEYQEGLEEYNEAVQEVEDELASGMSQIQSARRELGDIVTGKWYVLSCNDIMVNYSNFKMDAQRINAIADVFPVFFLLVAALVCLTTMSRMIDEQRIQIGTYKALGYRPLEIMTKYLIYAAIACIGGCIVGPLVCVQVLPRVIFGAYGTLYILPDFTISVPYDMYAVSVVVALLCTVLVAFIACWKELRTTTAALMRPKSPKAGKKIFLERIKPLWNSFSFFQKLTARNLFRYKVRLLMTVIGIAGCMALVVAGFGLNNAISPIVELQYDEIQHDDISINLDQNYSYKDISDVVLTLKENECVENCLLAGENSCKVFDLDEKNSLEDTYVHFPQDIEEANALRTLRDPSTHRNVEWSDDGVIITEKISKKLGVDVGDEFIVFLNDEKIPVTVCSIAENYLYNYVYMTPEYYQKTFGKEPLYNMLFVGESDKMVDRAAFSTDVLGKFDEIVLFYYTDYASGVMEDTMVMRGRTESHVSQVR